ncbi:MAG: hypothetical protein R6U85_05235 [Salinivirgaceae bacterium]
MRKFSKKYSALVSQYIIAGVLLFSGITKTLHIKSFISQVESDYQLGLLAVFAPALVLIEIWLGIQFLMGKNVKQTARYTVVLLIALTVFYTYGILWGNTENCGCFGNVFSQFSSPIFTYIRNLLLIILAYFVFKKPYELNFNYRPIIITGTLIISAFFIGFNSDASQIQKIILHGLSKTPSATTPKQSSDALLLVKKFNLSPQTSYMLFFYTQGCPYCLNSFENAKLYSERNFVDSVVFIEVLKRSNRPNTYLTDFYAIDAEYRKATIKREEYNQLSHIYPSGWIIKNNTIYMKHEGLIPSPLTVSYKTPEVFKFD